MRKTDYLRIVRLFLKFLRRDFYVCRKYIIRGMIDGNIYLRVESANNSTALVIPKGSSIVALCDPEFNKDNSVPSLNRFI